MPRKTVVFQVRLDPRIRQKLGWKAVDLATDPTELARRLITDGVKDAKQPQDANNPGILVPPREWAAIQAAAEKLGTTAEDFILAWARHGVSRTNDQD